MASSPHSPAPGSDPGCGWGTVPACTASGLEALPERASRCDPRHSNHCQATGTCPSSPTGGPSSTGSPRALVVRVREGAPTLKAARRHTQQVARRAERPSRSPHGEAGGVQLSGPAVPPSVGRRVKFYCAGSDRFWLREVPAAAATRLAEERRRVPNRPPLGCRLRSSCGCSTARWPCPRRRTCNRPQ